MDNPVLDISEFLRSELLGLQLIEVADRLIVEYWSGCGYQVFTK